MATCTPTPVRKPTEHRARDEVGQEAEPRNRATSSRNAAAISALRLANASHWALPGCRPAIPIPAIPAYMIAAVAESPPTTRWRDEPNRAYAAGSRIV